MPPRARQAGPTPAKIAQRVSAAGAAKGRQALSYIFVSGVLAGVFIALGALFYALIIPDSALGAGPTRLTGGLTFGVSLLLVIIAGDEHFTDNALMALPAKEQKVTCAAILCNRSAVYRGNLVGHLAHHGFGTSGLSAFRKYSTAYNASPPR